MVDPTPRFPLTTARLSLRPWAEADLEALVRLLNDNAIARWTARIPHPYRPEDAAQYLPIARAADPARDLHLAITRRVDGAVVGGIGAHPLEKPEERMLGYWIATGAAGQGFATEAARAVLDAVWRQKEVRCVRADVFSGNAPSERVLDKLGFSRTGGSRQHFPLRGKAQREVRHFVLERGTE